jgi:hypothetical protein
MSKEREFKDGKVRIRGQKNNIYWRYSVMGGCWGFGLGCVWVGGRCGGVVFG